MHLAAGQGQRDAYDRIIETATGRYQHLSWESYHAEIHFSYLTNWKRLAGIPEIQPADENAMSYIAPKPLSQYPFWLRWFLKRQERKYGRTLSPSWLWGRQPKLFAGMLGMLGVFQAQSYPIDRPLRSLISVRIAQLNGCWFCVDLNAYNMLKAAGSAEKAEKVSSWREETIYSERERAALEWAEMMTDTGRDNDPTLITELKMHFDEDAIVALTAWIAFQNLSAKFNAALGAEENGLCKLPDASRSRKTA